MNIVYIRPDVTVISTNLVYMAIYKRPTVSGAVPKHAWGIPMVELKRLEAGGMPRLGLATVGIDFARQEALKVALEAGRWIRKPAGPVGDQKYQRVKNLKF